MEPIANNKVENKAVARFAFALFVTLTVITCWASGQIEKSQAGEGCLLYRSPVSGLYEPVALLHTSAIIDVRGLVASATVTQQYANSGSEAINAVYVISAPARRSRL